MNRNHPYRSFATRRVAFCFCIALSPFFAGSLCGQTFVGTNAPGTATNFAFTVSAASTNLSLVITNTGSAWSHLLLKKGGTPTDADFDFISRLDGANNQINLEPPEFAATNYGLRVRTPSASAAHAFQVVLTTNRPDLRAAAYPVLKPVVFATTGVLSNLAGGSWHYFQVDVPTNLPGWRLVLSGATATNTPDLYLRRGALPTTASYLKRSVNLAVDTVVLTEAEATNSTYFIGVYLPGGAPSNAVYQLSCETPHLRDLVWDPGLAHEGTQVFTNASASGGNYFFRIVAQSTTVGAWRTALRVDSGEAHVYLRQGTFSDNPAGYTFKSERAGDDGFVLHSSQFAAGQTWYVCVAASPGAQWRLVSGEAYVLNLGTLAPHDSAASSTNVVMGPEGMRFFRTTTTADTLAWRLWLNGATNDILVKKTAVPHPLSASTYDLKQARQMLVVPSYLVGGDQYFVGVPGAPGTAIQLDSRRQQIIDAPFLCSSNLVVTGFGYVTYRINVPVQQIAWLTRLTPMLGEAHLCVRRDQVPNEWNNDAFSEVAGSTTDSISLVPPPPGSPSGTPGLSDGVFFVTIYGPANYNATFTSGNPVITDVPFVSVSTNDDPARVGWRYYRVLDVTNQLGTLGWELFLQNQPTNTELAIRRNAVPGRWNYRQNNSATVNSVGHVDFSGPNGFLQRPDHQADIWYVGVYNPTNALGAFVLHLHELTGTLVNFEGAVTNVTAQPPGRFYYWRVDVPAGALGWDLRLTNVTSGDPRLVVRREALPNGLSTGSWLYPYSATSWPTRYQWAAYDDWTDLNYDPAGVWDAGRILACGMGNPLEPGTYYVGVINGSSSSSPMSYTLVNRFIGPGFSIPVNTLSFSNSVATVSNLPPREVAYFQVNVPTNTESWDLRLATNSGEALLLIQKGALPNVGAAASTPTSLFGGRMVQKAGNEEYLLLPQSGATNIPGGTYYLAVVSEGQNPVRAQGRIGTGNITATLHSFGSMVVSNLGTLSGADLVANGALAGGDAQAWRFNVAPGIEALEVWLENKTGYPRMTLRADGLVPSPYDSYGKDGGATYTWPDDTVINVANPPATNFTLTVQAASQNGVYSNATFTIRVRRVASTPLAFDGGVVTMGPGHLAGTWRYFTVTVPSNALGWDLRITNITSGDPRLVVRHDTRPDSLSTKPWSSPQATTSWPSNYQWAAGSDWTEFASDADGTNRYGHILQMGMGNPLEPGTYFVGVINGTSSGYGTNEMRYSLVSRGIGPGFSIPVSSLAFTNGVVTISNLPPREAAYFSVQVPANLPGWKLKLSTNSGESLLLVQRGALPNVGGSGSPAYNLGGGRKMAKVGDEQYLLLPQNGQSNLASGTYYLLVASMGQNPGVPTSGRLGTNTSTATLQSLGVETPLNLGTVLPNSDIVYTDTLDGGATRLYQFTVPPGTLSMEVRLENRVANPRMTLRAGDLAPAAYGNYGNDGGQTAQWSHDSQILVANPTNGVYTLTVQADYTGPSTPSGLVYSNATYTVRVQAVGDLPIPFDGAVITVTNHEPNTWRYYVVTNVPADALGWEVRLTNVLSGDPRLVIRRASAPNSLSTTPWGNPGQATSWPSNYQWAAGYDWTGYGQDANGTNRLGHTLQMGMGNPLSPGGPYYIGVFNGSYSGWSTNIMRYTLTSRGIGPGYSIPVSPLAFAGGSVSNAALAARDAACYFVDVPSNTPSWKVRLVNGAGESLLLVQKDYLPNVLGGNSEATQVGGGFEMQKVGNEHYVLLPAAGQSFIPAGRYYMLVASEGQFPGSTGSGRIGTNASSYLLQSLGALPVEDLGLLPANGLARTNALEGGEIRAYRFTLSPGVPALEARLENRVGNPYLSLKTGPGLPRAYYGYGLNGGETYQWANDRLVTLANPAATNYSLVVQAGQQSTTVYPDASYVLRLAPSPVTDLAFDPALQGCGPGGQPCTNAVDCRTLADNERAFYRVQVPVTLPDGSPVLGWQLTVSNLAGNAQVRVRPGLLPSDTASPQQTSFASDRAVIVPPYLTPGTWFVEVKGVGPSQYCLHSAAVRLYRPAWTMPAPGQPITTPGLTNGPFFADTGVQTNGLPLPNPDGGIDLEQGAFHYYAVTVPPNNGGLLRMILEAISGNPDVFIRVGNVPTLSHNVPAPNSVTPAYERSLTGLTSEYANWVPDNGRYTNGIVSGTWFIGIRATGNANCRYRLRMSTGTVTNLPLSAGITNDTLAAGDWRYYRFFLPTNAPTNWVFSFQQHIGDVIVYVRDTVPPGQYASATDFRDWSSDNKNHAGALYRTYDPPGAYTNWVPPLRPGHVYYLGVRALTDATFSLSSSTNPTTIGELPTIAFYGGSVTNYLAPGERQRYAIDVPADATRWISVAIHSNVVRWYLEQGSLPTETSADHRWSGNAANVGINQRLNDPNGWPWLSGYRFYLVVTNTSAIAQPFSWTMDGRNCATDDSDADGLPDCWELLYWPSLSTQNGAQDYDADGNSNLTEFQDGTDPTNPQSMLARLTVNTVGAGSVNVSPAQPAYQWGTPVTLTALPAPGSVFLAWTGPGISGATNPLHLLMTTNRAVTAWFGLSNYVACGSLQADYRFQSNLLSSVGAPPPLAWINAGQFFTNELVDGVSSTVLRFPQGSGLVLSNATSVIPSNTYTIALLFKFDTVSGSRRILDTKNASPDHGLYVANGFLNLYPSGVQSATACVTNNTWHQIVLTRDFAGVVTVYSDGVARLSFNDSSTGYALISAANTVRFFKDNSTEESGGAVARIRLFTCALSPAEVAALDRLPAGPVLTLSNVGLDAQRRFYFRITGPALPLVRVQSSSNLLNWSNVAEYPSFPGALWHTNPTPVSGRQFFRVHAP